jgi:hypothetical protein
MPLGSIIYKVATTRNKPQESPTMTTTPFKVTSDMAPRSDRMPLWLTLVVIGNALTVLGYPEGCKSCPRRVELLSLVPLVLRFDYFAAAVSSTRATCIGFHGRPRRVVCPSAFSLPAMPRRESPSAFMASMDGSKSV